MTDEQFQRLLQEMQQIRNGQAVLATTMQRAWGAIGELSKAVQQLIDVVESDKRDEAERDPWGLWAADDDIKPE